MGNQKVTELDEFRKNMIQQLHHPNAWPVVDAVRSTIACPFCGCTIFLPMKEIHIAWHERNNA